MYSSSIRKISIRTGEALMIFSKHQNEVISMKKVFADEKIIISASSIGNIIVWNHVK